MGSNDIPPSHVPLHVVSTCSSLLQVGGVLWTICYVLMLRESSKTRTYGMPLFALAMNFGWEIVYALYVVETELEFLVFGVWLVIDCGLVYYLLKYGRNEWRNAPVVATNLGTILSVMIVYTAVGQFSFAKWWIDNDIGKREGKFYRGVMGPDTTELGFWSSALVQAYLSASSLVQLVIRRHSGGISWGIWVTRTLGSILGLYLNFGWAWYFWTEAHEYFMSPFGIFLWGTGLVCDLIYPFIFYQVRNTERILPDGSKPTSAAPTDKRKKRRV